MYYKIKIQCLAIIYHFFSPDYSSVVDNHSVLHIITVILLFTLIAANMEHLQRPKKVLQAYKYEAGYVISFVFFSLTLPSFCLRVLFVSPKTHLYSYFSCSSSCVGKLN